MEKTRKRRGTGRVTLQEVANFAGVGTMTVSRALRTPEQVSDKLREKIEQAVEELGYIPQQNCWRPCIWSQSYSRRTGSFPDR